MTKLFNIATRKVRGLSKWLAVWKNVLIAEIVGSTAHPETLESQPCQ